MSRITTRSGYTKDKDLDSREQNAQQDFAKKMINMDGLNKQTKAGK